MFYLRMFFLFTEIICKLAVLNKHKTAKQHIENYTNNFHVPQKAKIDNIKSNLKAFTNQLMLC